MEQNPCRECGHVHKTDFYCLYVLGPGESCACVVGVKDRYDSMQKQSEEMVAVSLKHHREKHPNCPFCADTRDVMNEAMPIVGGPVELRHLWRDARTHEGAQFNDAILEAFRIGERKNNAL